MSTDILNGIKELWHVPSGRLLYGKTVPYTMTYLEGHWDRWETDNPKPREQLLYVKNGIFIKRFIGHISNISNDILYGAYDSNNNRTLYNFASNVYKKILYVNENDNYMVCQGNGNYQNKLYVINLTTGSEIWSISASYDRCYIGAGFGKIVIFDSQYWIKIYNIKTKSKIREIKLDYPNSLPNYYSDNDIRFCLVNTDNSAVAGNRIYNLTTGGYTSSDLYVNYKILKEKDSNDSILEFNDWKLREVGKKDMKVISEWDIKSALTGKFTGEFSNYRYPEIYLSENDKVYLLYEESGSILDDPVKNTFSCIFNLKTNTLEKYYANAHYFFGNGFKLRYFFDEYLHRFIMKDKI